MGREIRRVPPGWQHPTDDEGHPLPLFDEDHETAVRDWRAQRGEARAHGYTLEEWAGNEPDPACYRPAWTEDATAYQVYENVSEGTPISPVFETREALLEWLTQPDGAPCLGLGGRPAILSREQAERFIEVGYAPSFVMTIDDRGVKRAVNGVEAL
jgi:hypothetical protein